MILLFYMITNIWFLKNTQQAISSNTLSTTPFTNAEGQCHKSGSQQDAKQQLSHSQSMILDENEKVFPSTQTHKPLSLLISSMDYAMFTQSKEEI